MQSGKCSFNVVDTQKCPIDETLAKVVRESNTKEEAAVPFSVFLRVMERVSQLGEEGDEDIIMKAVQ